MVKRSRKKMFAIRLEPEDIEALNEVAKSQGITTSGVIRAFAKNATTLYEIVKQQNQRQETERQAFADNLSEWILKNTPSDMNPDLMHLMASIMHQAAEIREKQVEKQEVK